MVKNCETEEKRRKKKHEKNKRKLKMKKMMKISKSLKSSKVLSSHAKSSIISRVCSCCCNIFRQTPLRFPWFCFRNAFFLKKINNQFWGGHHLFRRKVTNFIGRETKHTVYGRKSTKNKFVKVSFSYNNFSFSIINHSTTTTTSAPTRSAKTKITTTAETTEATIQTQQQ